MKNFDVVVVGGGPVGLWSACELRLAGLDVCLLERRDEPMQQSRALTIHGRSLELFAMRGIVDRFLAEGQPIPTGHFGVLDTRLAFSGFDTRYPFTLFLPQCRTEMLLEDHARALGVVVLRGHTVEGVGGDPASGYVVAARHGGGSAAFHARAVVGADARRSIVRQSADIAFEGHDATLSIMMGDIRMEHWEGPPVRTASNERGLAMVVPVGQGDLMRVIVIDRDRLQVPVGEPLPLEELARSTSRVLGEDVRMSNPYWLTRFGDETRLAEIYRRGNLFLAGDAAHIHAPAGGQGMNVGLQDAMNLGWKLAAVLKREAPDALLDSYGIERRPIGAQLARNTLAQIALMTGFDEAHLALRAELSDLLTVPQANHRVAGALSGFDLTYPLVAPFEAAPGAGERVADRTLALADGSAASLHGLLADGRWLHLSFVAGARRALPEWLHEDGVRFVEVRSVEGDDGAPPAAAMLVRPDGYCAGKEMPA